MIELETKEYIIRETYVPLAGCKQEVVGEIVRCKDCLHKHKNWVSFDTNDKPLHHCEVLNQMTRDDFFCAEGIRGNDG